MGLAAILACGAVPQATLAQGPAPAPQGVEQQRQLLLDRLAVLQTQQAAAPTAERAQLIDRIRRSLAQLPPAPAPPPFQPPPVQPPGEGPAGDGPPPPPADILKAQELFKSGPSTSRPGLSSTFSIQGFIREDWPIVMDFEPQPNTRTELTVSLLTPVWVSRRISILVPVPQGGRVVDEDGSRGRQVLHLRQGPLSAPGGLGGRPVQIAEYGLVSYRLVDGRIARDDRGRPIRAPVAVRGFGAGPRAEGSVTINNVFLTPATLSRPPGGPQVVAGYSYFAEKPFDQANADIWLSCSRVFCSRVHPLGPDIRYLASSGWVRGTWNVRQNARAGTYQLFVRAWLHCNGGDPINNYRGCGDEAAWATGYSDLLTLQ